MLALARQLFCVILLLMGTISGSPVRQAPERKGFRVAIPNLHAPELYSRFIKVRITLVDLPGAGDPASNWEMSYQLYHISEESFDRAAGKRRAGGWNPMAADFPGHVLLGGGKFKRGPLSQLQDRVFVSQPIPFKSKVADKNRTKFAHLMLIYSLKISDARLHSTIYKSSAFFNDPFETQDGREVARTTFHLSFRVTPQGALNASIMPEHANATSWR